jgi:hypothetical protein
MRDELLDAEVMNSIVDLLKVLPTRDFEFTFIADLLFTVN